MAQGAVLARRQRIVLLVICRKTANAGSRRWRRLVAVPTPNWRRPGRPNSMWGVAPGAPVIETLLGRIGAEELPDLHLRVTRVLFPLRRPCVRGICWYARRTRGSNLWRTTWLTIQKFKESC